MIAGLRLLCIQHLVQACQHRPANLERCGKDRRVAGVNVGRMVILAEPQRMQQMAHGHDISGRALDQSHIQAGSVTVFEYVESCVG